jgi:hypothetical protein
MARMKKGREEGTYPDEPSWRRRLHASRSSAAPGLARPGEVLRLGPGERTIQPASEARRLAEAGGQHGALGPAEGTRSGRRAAPPQLRSGGQDGTSGSAEGKQRRVAPPPLHSVLYSVRVGKDSSEHEALEQEPQVGPTHRELRNSPLTGRPAAAERAGGDLELGAQRGPLGPRLRQESSAEEFPACAAASERGEGNERHLERTAAVRTGCWKAGLRFDDTDT